ncbi:hypothetical protein A9Q87_09270 [Flavobacteriales bacterium 34_180_T64]|nr:hypothetical protein A9Q87_09270 [Flavobacteriales bacterium 34_180_T64]
MSPKEIVKSFYDMDLANAPNAIDLFHNDCDLHWNSTNGYTKLDYSGINEMLEGVKKAFLSFKYRLSHLLEDDNVVTARYTIYVTPIETPDIEQALAHFTSIWHIKDNKLFKGYEISQQADDGALSTKSYSEIKV